MLVCSLHNFRLENSVDSKYLMTKGTNEYSGFVVIKRGKEKFKSATRILQDSEGVKTLALASSFEISDVRERRQQQQVTEGDLFASMQEEHETDVVTLSVKIYAAKSGVQIYHVVGFLNISDYKKRPERRHEVSLKMHKQPLVSHGLGIADEYALTEGVRSADGILSLQLIYTADNEHPSLLNFIACGLFLCPATTPLDRGANSSIEDRERGAGERRGGTGITDACMKAALCGVGSHDTEGSQGGTAVDYTGDMKEEAREGDQHRRLRHQGQEEGGGANQPDSSSHYSQQHQKRRNEPEYSFAAEILKTFQSWPAVGAAPSAPFPTAATAAPSGAPGAPFAAVGAGAGAGARAPGAGFAPFAGAGVAAAYVPPPAAADVRRKDD